MYLTKYYYSINRLSLQPTYSQNNLSILYSNLSLTILIYVSYLSEHFAISLSPFYPLFSIHGSKEIIFQNLIHNLHSRYISYSMISQNMILNSYDEYNVFGYWFYDNKEWQYDW